MVEESVIYEEIKFGRCYDEKEEDSSSEDSVRKQPEDENSNDFNVQNRNSCLYEEMNELVDELAQNYDIHALKNLSNLIQSSTPVTAVENRGKNHVPHTNNNANLNSNDSNESIQYQTSTNSPNSKVNESQISHNTSTNIAPSSFNPDENSSNNNQHEELIYLECSNLRNASNSSSEKGETTNYNSDYTRPRQYNMNGPFTRPKSQSLNIERALQYHEHENEIIYTEIVPHQSSTEITTGRITRESENPILQQSKFSDDKDERKATSLVNLRMRPEQDESLYAHYNPHNPLTMSLDRRKNKKASHYIDTYAIDSTSLYENSSLISSNSLMLYTDLEEIYQNSHLKPDTTIMISTPSSPLQRKRNALESSQQQQEQKHSCTNPFITVNQSANSSEMVHGTPKSSLYENVTEGIYEKLSDNEWEFLNSNSRDRLSTRSIDISVGQDKRVKYDKNFDDQDYKRTVPRSMSAGIFCVPSIPSSVTSSPRGSTCSSISSELSSLPTRSMSPHPPPFTSRKRTQGNTSWSNMSSFVGLNYFPANYLGRQHVSKITRDIVDNAVSFVAQHTNLLEMKPVHTEVTHELVRIGSNSSPWELLESFAIEEVITYEVFSKNVHFIGIVAGKPGYDAYCCVLQSEKATEIGDAIREAFQTVPNKIQRTRSSAEIQSIQPEFHRFHYLVRIGSTKVRRSFHNCVNDYITFVLEKEHPRDFCSINLEVLGSKVLISDTQTDEEISHSTPSILSLGVYSKDKRYFGYMLSEVTNSQKERVQCYVYRAARNNTAAKIIDAISTSYQVAYTPKMSQNCELNPIYTPSPTNRTSDTKINNMKVIKTSYHQQQDDKHSLSVNPTQELHTSSISNLPTYEKTEKCPKPKNRISQISLSSRIAGLKVKSGEKKRNSVHLISKLGFSSGNDMSLVDTDNNSFTLLNDSVKIELESNNFKRSPLLKRERPKSLPLIDFNSEEEERDSVLLEERSPHVSDQTDQQKSSKHKTFLNKIKSSTKQKHYMTQSQVDLSLNSIEKHYSTRNTFSENTPTRDPQLEKRTADENYIIYPTCNVRPEKIEVNPSVHEFSLSYICSTVVTPPLRPKHVKHCYKQFTKEMAKAGKMSHNSRPRTFGSAVVLKIVTNQDIVMLDPTDKSTVIRKFPVEIIDRVSFHPDPTLNYFAFSTIVPGNEKQNKCHLFSIQNDLRNQLQDVFHRIDHIKKMNAS